MHYESGYFKVLVLPLWTGAILVGYLLIGSYIIFTILLKARLGSTSYWGNSPTIMQKLLGNYCAKGTWRYLFLASKPSWKEKTNRRAITKRLSNRHAGWDRRQEHQVRIEPCSLSLTDTEQRSPGNWEELPGPHFEWHVSAVARTAGETRHADSSAE